MNMAILQESTQSPEPTDLEKVIQDLKDENNELSSRLERENRIRKDLERRLSINPKTGLPSHYRLLNDFEAIIDSMKLSVQDPRLTVLFIQLGSAFSEIRKSFKATVIEWIVYQTACRLQALKRPNDLLYHTRDNEFVFILQGLRGDDLRGFLSTMMLALDEPYIFSGFNIYIPANAGASYFPEHGADKSDILKSADIALETAISEGIAFKLFSNEMTSNAMDRVELQNSIIRAIEAPALKNFERQFILSYQPKIFIKEMAGDTIVIDKIEAEVLMRWRHPSKGHISPNLFIPLAEETGLIHPLGKWLFYSTVEAYKKWNAETKHPLHLSINVSARQMKTPEIIESIAHLVTTGELNPQYVTLELTETSMFEDPARAGVMIEDFKRMGFRISLDDFGTGYSSLSLIHRYPIDEIKIDKLFTQDLKKSPQDRVIVQTIIEMSKRLGIAIIAEGVEDLETLRDIYEMGCSGIQGYIVSKALTLDEYQKFYKKVMDQNGVLKLKDYVE